MTEATDQALVEFRKEFELLAPAFECAAIAFFAVKHKGKCVVTRAQVRLFATSISNFTRIRSETEGFIAGIELAEKKAIEPLVRSITKDGTLTVADLALSFYGAPERFIVDFRGLRSALNANWPRIFSLNVFDNAPVDLYSLCGGRTNVDFMLRSLPAPYDGLDDLFNVLGLNLGGSDNQTRLVLLGDVPVILDRDASKFSPKGLHVEIRGAEGIEHERVRIGYRLIPDAPASRASIEGAAITWAHTKGSTLRGKVDIPATDTVAAHVFVSYRDQTFDKWWIANPDRHVNLRLAAYVPFDIGRAVLRETLATSVDRYSDDFEHSVGVLLSLCGFAVSHIGQMSRLREGPDLIGVTPRGEVLIVEATTTGVLDTKDKLSKLVTRYQQLKEQLGKTGWGHSPVQALIVSSAPRAQLTDLDKAKVNRIAVAGAEDLTTLFERIVAPIDPSDVFASIAKLVPS